MYDVIVLGTGPAGSEALHLLAKSGLKVLGIEKRRKGEPKPCGGAIPLKEVEIFGELPPHVYDFTVKKAVLKNSRGEEIVLTVKEGDLAGYTVKREEYDRYLMERAEEAGARINYRERVISIEREKERFRITTDKDEYTSRFLLLSMGQHSFPFFKRLGFNPYPFKRGGVAIQKVIEGEFFKEPETLLFYFIPEKLKGGYFWVFPKKGRTYIGCGAELRYTVNRNLENLLDEFIEKNFGNVKVIRREGGFVPFYPVKTFAKDGVFLLGDSAGLTNSIHGGGIYEARLSGKLAAESLLSYEEEPELEYSKRVNQSIIEYSHRWDRRMRTFLLSEEGMELIWNMGKKNQKVRDSLGIILSSSKPHSFSYKILYEKVFEEMNQRMIEAIGEYRDLINREVRKLFREDRILNEIINYSLLENAKRLRSGLVLLIAESLGQDVEKALPIAIAYELSHTASLLHDDIIDNGDKRRGKESLHIRYGIEEAIIAGDALLIKAFEMLSHYRDNTISREQLIELIKCGTESGMRASQGELMDIYMGREPEKYGIIDYVRMIKLKTGALIEAPCEAGAILAGRDELRTHAKMFGRYLGISFQIFDDSKDIFSPEEVSLKTKFADIRNKKPSLYIIWVLKKLRGVYRERFMKLLGKKNLTEDEISFLYRIFEETGVIDFTKRILKYYIEKALAQLSYFPRNRNLDRLINLAQAMTYWVHI